jgi:hypothetical protein
VHKSTDRGTTWTVISGDLTSNNADWQTFRKSGGLTPDVTAAENYTTIVSIAPSPVEAGTLWVGTDDGRVHVTRDGGKSWNRVDERARGVPAGSWVPMIAPSPHDAGTAFIVFDNHRHSDMGTYAYRVDNYGREWKSLTTDALSGYALSILQDHVDPGLLFLGTEFGLFISTNGGADWVKFDAGLPTVSVMDMAIQERENDLVLGTHGRSIFILDDYSALRGLDESSFTQRLAILSASKGQQYQASETPSTRFTGSGEFRAENKPYGVMITFMASGDDLPLPVEEAERERLIRQRAASTAKDPDEPVKTPKVELTVRTQDGELIRTQRFDVYQGVNRVVWEMNRDGVRPLPMPEPADLEDGLPGGIEVPAGEYEVTLSLAVAEGEPVTSTRRVTVLADPRLTATARGRLENYRTLLELQAMQEVAVTAVERVVHARADVATAQALIKQKQQPGALQEESLKKLTEQARKIQKALLELENRLRVPPETRGYVYDDDKAVSRIGLAMYYVASSHDAPTETAEVYIDLARRSLDEAVQAVDQFMNIDLPAFRLSLSDAGIGLFTSSIEP